jgi:predicted ATPase
LPATAALRREAINLQVALITPLAHVKGFAAPETKAAAEQARLLIEQAQALGEPPEDPLLLFLVVYAVVIESFVAFNGDKVLEGAAQFLALAEKEGSAVPLMIGHRLQGGGLVFTGRISESRPHFDRAIALYEPTKHRQLAMRFGQDARVSVLSFRSLALWMLGYPDAALADTHKLLSEARDIDQAATLMFALVYASIIDIHCGNYAAAKTRLDEVVALAEKKGALFWKTLGTIWRGWLFALTGKASDAVQMISSGISALRSTGSTVMMPLYLACLARAHAEFNQFDDARRYIGEALTTIEATKERWWESDIHRTAGEIALKSPEPDLTKAEAYFERALEVARQQHAKSWELRAATSLARLWRDQGKLQQARELLALVYGWFTEGFDTLDLKEAKALLGELAE